MLQILVFSFEICDLLGRIVTKGYKRFCDALVCKMQRGKQCLRRVLFLVVFAFGLMLSSVVAHGQVLTFGVVPQQSASKLAQQWLPLLKAWSELSGVELHFATAPDIPTFERRLAAGEYDLAYMNPYHFTLFNVAPGYQALARAKSKSITGIIVALKSWQGQLDSLAGETLVFPAPRAFAATLLTQSELAQMSIPISAKFVGSHDSVYLTVAKGLYPAGGGIMRTFLSLSPEIRSQLQVIYKTRSYTAHAIAAHPNVSVEIQEKLVASLDNLSTHALAIESFEMLKIEGLQMAIDSDWNDVVALDIQVAEVQP